MEINNNSLVLFSIDVTDRVGLQAFQDFIVANDAASSIKPLIGCYNGEQEPAFGMAASKFKELVLGSEWVEGQESFLEVTGCNKAYCTLHYQDGRPSEYLGSFCAVSERVARSYPAWTYDPLQNAWFIAAHYNPDHASHIKPYGEQAKRDWYLDDMDVKDGDIVVCAHVADRSDFTEGDIYTVVTVIKNEHTGKVIYGVRDDKGVMCIPSVRFAFVSSIAGEV